jgi:hypothetical protein
VWLQGAPLQCSCPEEKSTQQVRQQGIWEYRGGRGQRVVAVNGHCVAGRVVWLQGAPLQCSCPEEKSTQQVRQQGNWEYRGEGGSVGCCCEWSLRGGKGGVAAGCPAAVLLSGEEVDPAGAPAGDLNREGKGVRGEG